VPANDPVQNDELMNDEHHHHLPARYGAPLNCR
jgi:hypothetical protein